MHSPASANILTTLLIIASSTALAQQQTPATLHYQLALDSNTLHVTLTYYPVEPDSTVFVYGEPNFGGQPDIFDAVRNVTALSRIC